MPCYSPLKGWRAQRPTASGKYPIVFNPRLGFRDMPMSVPCGQCIGCRLERSRQWAIRCVHEAQLHGENSFLTLTYSEESAPSDFGLNLRHIQLFCKKLRKRIGPFRFFHAGEYGSTTGRPHYHMCIFGYRPDDLKVYKVTAQGHRLYTSKLIDEIWGMGKCWIGDVSFESAAYVARYILKKINGKMADDHYQGRKPEYVTMSRRPGIGAKWLEKYKDDVYRFDELVLRGKRMRAPRSYDRLLELVDPTLMASIKLRRKISAIDRSPEDLRASEVVKNAQLQALRRPI